MVTSLLKNAWEYFQSEAPLEIDKEGKPSIEDVQLGVLFLLGEMSAVDGDFSTAEFREVVDSMQDVFRLSEEKLLQLLRLA